MSLEESFEGSIGLLAAVRGKKYMTPDFGALQRSGGAVHAVIAVVGITVYLRKLPPTIRVSEALISCRIGRLITGERTKNWFVPAFVGRQLSQIPR